MGHQFLDGEITQRSCNRDEVKEGIITRGGEGVLGFSLYYFDGSPKSVIRIDMANIENVYEFIIKKKKEKEKRKRKKEVLS